MAPTSEIVTTPSGLKIVYYDKSHRYKLGFIGEDGSTVDPVFVPSVSTILDKTLPKNLTGWAERLTVLGVIQLTQLGRETNRMGPDAILKELHANGLRYYQSRDAAAERGTAIHKAMEVLAEGGMPNLRNYPIAQRGYVQGLCKFWLEYDPEVIYSELMVASWRFQYAGRLDLVVDMGDGIGVLDLKTSRAIRESHHFQTAAYMQALGESGYTAGEWGGILRVGEDGTFEFQEALAEPSDFVALISSYRVQKDFDGRQRAALKAAETKAA